MPRTHIRIAIAPPALNEIPGLTLIQSTLCALIAAGNLLSFEARLDATGAELLIDYEHIPLGAR